MAIWDKFKKGMEKSRAGFGDRLGYLFRSRKNQRELFDEMEEILISADAGIDFAVNAVDEFRRYCDEQALRNSDEMLEGFGNYLTQKIPEVHLVPEKGVLNIVMMLGVNGSGKTTTTGKLAERYVRQGFKVMIAAADTFRAAAIEQLESWAMKAGVPVVRQQTGSDPGAVVFDAIQSAKAKKADLLLIDTAGRFHNRDNLVRELQKVDKVINKTKGETDRCFRIAVLDATAGSNAFIQAQSFGKAVPLDGVILTKMDSSAKGGVVIPIAVALQMPVYMLGLGEQADDLVDFNRRMFVDALLGTAAQGTVETV